MKREIRKVVQPLPSHVLPIAVGGECRKYIYKVHKDEVVMSKEKACGPQLRAVKMAASKPTSTSLYHLMFSPLVLVLVVSVEGTYKVDKDEVVMNKEKTETG